ncbi:MAG TPA: hypothetical protein PLD54_03320, partial [Candidatus Levybacteria bacterium]|nr:hypothetical protein [Candidatus Levybacteria bacterium]
MKKRAYRLLLIFSICLISSSFLPFQKVYADSTWVLTIVDPTLDFGSYTSLAMGSDGFARI